jgi:hypothetical protein
VKKVPAIFFVTPSNDSGHWAESEHPLLAERTVLLVGLGHFAQVSMAQVVH